MGKKAQLYSSQFQQRLVQACKENDVKKVLAIYQEWEAAECLPPHVVPQVLNALCSSSSAGQDKKAGAEATSSISAAYSFEQAKRVFDKAAAHMKEWGRLGESIFTLMVRLASRAGEPALAREYLVQMRRPPVSIQPKLRTFIPILDACVERGLAMEAEALYKDEVLPACGPTEPGCLFLNTDEEERCWQSLLALRLQAVRATWQKDSSQNGAARNELMAIFKAIIADVEHDAGEIRLDSALEDSLKSTFETLLAWQTARNVEIGEDGRCPATGYSLRGIPCKTADLSGLVSLIERLALEGAFEPQKAAAAWTEFKEFLDRNKDRWDTIIDGANVGHHNRNFENGDFSHEQIEEVLQECGRAGRKGAVVVLRGRWLDPAADFQLPAVKPKKRRLPQLVANASSSPSAPEAAATPSQPSQGKPRAAGYGGGGSAVPPSDCILTALDAAAAQKAGCESTLPPRGPQRVAYLVSEWRRRGQLVEAPHAIDDDWVALYLALVMCLSGESNAQMVTNDEFRDHFWRMRRPQAFLSWRERHVTQYHIFSDRTEDSEKNDPGAIFIKSIQLFPPPAYTSRAQGSFEGGHWHFPIRLPDPPAAAVAECTGTPPPSAATTVPAACGAKEKAGARPLPPSEEESSPVIIGPPKANYRWLAAWAARG
eukprot:TRINITY_DN50608_c0_g1_i1.p1 TRINITY_DN50608_c0_g1~~TRINITY_DN50608_c0_g1_i1.p1  ORF type:complete len:656 (+),score=155.78 TRINITY_DN50608_c0_g1_i1:138-2105(+)